MAKMTVNPPDELIHKLAQLVNRMDDIAPAILNAGIDTLEERIKQNASRHVETGGMVNSIKRTKPKKNKNGIWQQRVQFVGYDKNRKATPSDPRGVPHARKAMSLEYGTSKQPATPFIRPAVVASEHESTNAMQQAFDREVAKL